MWEYFAGFLSGVISYTSHGVIGWGYICRFVDKKLNNRGSMHVCAQAIWLCQDLQLSYLAEAPCLIRIWNYP